ncbi:hypothetical protein ACFQL1_22490 [Halomicroarcula sp. GCM10025709]|uniref:hypothetical protein n=1 Tax=Halomicroarcula sp. GCM10025709 TaxID=3252669 RepID=UPI00360AC1D4
MPMVAEDTPDVRPFAPPSYSRGRPPPHRAGERPARPGAVGARRRVRTGGHGAHRDRLELGLSEANPVARSALSLLGPAGLVLLKGFSLGLLAVIVRTVPGRFEPAALLGFCLPQAAATGVNATLILSQTGTIAGL